MNVFDWNKASCIISWTCMISICPKNARPEKTNTVHDCASFAFVKHYLLLSSIFWYQESVCSVRNDPSAKGHDISLTPSLSGLYSGSFWVLSEIYRNSLFFSSLTLSCALSLTFCHPQSYFLSSPSHWFVPLSLHDTFCPSFTVSPTSFAFNHNWCLSCL